MLMDDNEGATWADVLILLDWLKSETERIKADHKEFSDAMWLTRQFSHMAAERAARDMDQWWIDVQTRIRVQLLEERRQRDAGVSILLPHQTQRDAGR